MTTLVAILVILVIVLGIISGFLAKEFLKKFSFMKSFVEQSNQLVELKYKGRLSPGMRNIVLSGNAPFRVLIGFKLRIPIIGYTGFDYYGEAESDENGAVVISTFIGKGPCVFQFFVNTDLSQNPIKAEAGCAEQSMTPDVVYPPHWYQKYLGFYA